MATQYFSVSTHWSPGTFPNPELQSVLFTKAAAMMSAGKMVNGKLNEHLFDAPVFPDGYTLQTVERGETSDRERPIEMPITFNFVYNFDHTTRKVTLSINPAATQKALRILKTEADATEWIDFGLGLGAERSVVLTPDEMAAQGLILPDDSIIVNYFNLG